jgi:hypothetical protein
MPVEIRIWDGEKTVGRACRILEVACRIFSLLSGDRAVEGFDVANEPVSPFGQSLDKTWVVCRIRKRLTEPVYRLIEALVEVDECVSGPQLLLQFLARDESTRTMQKREENLKGLGRDGCLVAIVTQFCRIKIELIIAQLNFARGLQRTGHRGYPKLRWEQSLSPPASTWKQASFTSHKKVT